MIMISTFVLPARTGSQASAPPPDVLKTWTIESNSCSLPDRPFAKLGLVLPAHFKLDIGLTIAYNAKYGYAFGQ